MAVRRALFLSSGSEIFNRLVNLLSVLLFARLLSPNELGVFIIASSIMVLASEVRMLGTNTYLISEAEISEQKVSNALGLSLIISWGLGIIAVTLSPLVASFYDQKELMYLVVILSGSFFFAPFVSCTHALLSREFSFGRLFFLTNVGPVIALFVSVTLINLDYSYYSLAVGQTLGYLVDLLIGRVLKPKSMSWKPKFDRLKSVARVGIYTSLINMFTRFESTIPDLILGKLASTSFVAFFSRALGLHLFIQELLCNGISKIALPYISEQKRADKCMKDTYKNASEMTLGFILPPAICATIAAETLIMFLFGDQWGASVGLAKVLGVWIVLKTLTYYAIPTLITNRAEKELFYSRAITLGFLIVAIVFCVAMEPRYISLAFVATGIIDYILISWLLYKQIHLNPFDYLFSIKKTLFISLICSSVTLFISQFNEHFDNYMMLGIYLVVLVPTWLIMLLLVKHPLALQIKSLIPQR